MRKTYSIVKRQDEIEYPAQLLGVFYMTDNLARSQLKIQLYHPIRMCSVSDGLNSLLKISLDIDSVSLWRANLVSICFIFMRSFFRL